MLFFIAFLVFVCWQAVQRQYRRSFEALCSNYRHLRAFMSRDCFDLDHVCWARQNVREEHTRLFTQQWGPSIGAPGTQSGLVNDLTVKLFEDPQVPRYGE